MHKEPLKAIKDTCTYKKLTLVLINSTEYFDCCSQY